MIGGIFKQFASAGLNKLLKTPLVLPPTRRTRSFSQSKEQLLSIAVKNIYNDIPKYYKRKLQLSAVPKNEYASTNLSPVSRLVTDEECSEQMKLPLSSTRPKYRNLTPIFLQQMARRSARRQAQKYPRHLHLQQQQQQTDRATMPQLQKSKSKSMIPAAPRRFYSSKPGCSITSSSSSFMRRLDIRKNMFGHLDPLQQSYLMRAYSTQRSIERRLNDMEMRQPTVHLPPPPADTSDCSTRRRKGQLNVGELMPVSSKVKQQLCVPRSKNTLGIAASHRSLLEQKHLKKFSLLELKNVKKLQKLRDDYRLHLKKLSNDLPSERGEFCRVQRKLTQQCNNFKNKSTKRPVEEPIIFKSREYQTNQAEKLRRLKAKLLLSEQQETNATAKFEQKEVPRPREVSKQLQMQQTWFSCCKSHKLEPQLRDMNLELLKNLICNTSNFHQQKIAEEELKNHRKQRGTQRGRDLKTVHRKNERNQGNYASELFID